jgi:hypothetical protein
MATSYIRQGKVPVCGSLDGLDYVLVSELQAVLPRMDIEEIIAVGNLKVMGEGANRLVGVPR